ncbi:hypothetical protein ACLKA7_011635 [Drosophila subpalustris]
MEIDDYQPLLRRHKNSYLKWTKSKVLEFLELVLDLVKDVPEPLEKPTAQKLSTVAAATTSKSSQSTISKSEMVTMPTDPKVKAVATSEMEAPAPSAKKSRVQPGRSFAQIAKDRILIGVLDRGNPDGRIPRNQWRWIESALAIQCFELLEKEPGPPPVCKDVGWYQGTVKVIACDDSRSAELYRAAVANVGEVYPGAKLAAVNWEDVPVRPRARMWIPSTIKEPEKLLTMLQRCNPNLPTQDWRVAKIEEMPGPTNQAVIILNKESLAPIDAAGGELNFGFSSVFIRVYKSDAAVGSVPSDKPVEEDITSELEAPERPEMDGYMSDASSLTRDLRKLWQTASAALMLRLAGGGADIALIQEPWVVCGKVSGLGSPDYKLFVSNAQGNIRTCILARKHLNAFMLHNFRNEDNTAVSLELQPAPVRLLACYMAYDQEGPLPEDITQSLISDCELNKIGLIDRKEVIDLTLVSHPLSNLTTEWKVSDEHSFSDHRYIEFVLNLKPPKPLQFTNLRKTNWSKYQTLFRKAIPEKAPEGPHSEACLYDLIKTFTTACKSSCKASCPVSRPKGSKKPPWWTHNLNNLRKISRTLFNQAKASNLVEAWIQDKLQLAEYKKEIRRAKRSSWHSFCSEIESTTEAARLRKILSKSAPTLGYLKRDNDTWTTSSEESLEAPLTKHFPGCSQHDIRNQQNSSEVRLNPSPYSSHNINWAINSFKTFKSPGPDGIAPAHLQHTEGGGCQIVAYADDVAVIFTGKYPQTLCDLMTVKLNMLATWADKCGLGNGGLPYQRHRLQGS